MMPPRKIKCGWCHSMVQKPCTTILECKTCPEPYTLTAEQTARFREIANERVPRRAAPLSIELMNDNPPKTLEEAGWTLGRIWLCILVWTVTGGVFGAWAALGFPTGVLL